MAWRKRGFQREEMRRLLVHLPRIELEVVAPGRLGVIHRRVGILHQRKDLVAVVGNMLMPIDGVARNGWPSMLTVGPARRGSFSATCTTSSGEDSRAGR
jgi:hypothetical protein